MLPIYICEDENSQRHHLQTTIEKIILMENLDAHLALSTSRPDLLINTIARHPETSVYFLDIDLKSTINGLELAEEIRKYDPWGFIIFVTTHDEMMPLTFRYRVGALDYIIKEDRKSLGEKIHQSLLECMCRYQTPAASIQEVITIQAQEKLITLKLNDIVYMETTGEHRQLVIHTVTSIIQFSSTLREISDSLDERFIRCSKSCIVNKDFIKEVNKMNRKITLKNGLECMCSFRLLKQVCDSL